MNLQENIRRILREEDFIPLEDLNTVIKDYEDGFDVLIMNGDKKIGEISFVKESIPNLYTIVDATIDDEYKGNRIYPKTIINLFKERPNIIINSVFRSPEAEKAWRYILSNLPPNIGKSVKYYKEEDTTLYQLKLRNIQESIKKILREETNIPPSVKRRLHYVDEYIDKLVSNDVCNHWTDDEVDEYVNGTLSDIIRTIIGDSSGINSDNYGSVYDVIYEFLVNLNYPEQIKDFFYESLETCSPKSRMNFFRRRVNLDDVKWFIPVFSEQVFHETDSYEQFKYEVTLRAVESVMWNEYQMGWEDLPEQEEIEFVTQVSNIFEDIIIDLYKNIRGKL